MSVATDSLRTDLANLLSPAQVLTGADECAACAVDGKTPECVVFPETVEQTAAVLRYGSQHELAVILRGNGTKVLTGNPPRRYDLALSLRRLQRVVHYEPADLTVSVEAGMKFGALQNLVGQNGLWLPLDPRGGAEATMGGIVAANAAGPLRQAFGSPRDMVLGLRFATADGKLVRTGGRVVKNVAGYDFCKLLTGSWGTLGAIVEVNLKLFPKPAERSTFTMCAGTLGIARDLRRRILRSPIDPLRLVVLDAHAVALLSGPAQTPGVQLWIELGGSHRVIERCLLELRQLTSAVGATLERREDAECVWESISDLPAWLQPSYAGTTVLKSALPLTASEEFLSRAEQESESEHIPLAGFAQVGVGIAHLCALQESSTIGMAGWVARLRQAARELGGTLVLEHCPTGVKNSVDVWGACGDDVEVMRKLKSAWDPAGTLAPGRFAGFQVGN